MTMFQSNIVLIFAYVSLVAGLIFLFRYVVGVARCIEAQHKALLHMRTELRTAIDGQSVLELRLDDITTYRAIPLTDLPDKFPPVNHPGLKAEASSVKIG